MIHNKECGELDVVTGMKDIIKELNTWKSEVLRSSSFSNS